MFSQSLIFWLVLNVSWAEIITSGDLSSYNRPRESRSTTSGPTELTSNPNNDILYDTCSMEDFACLAIAASDRHGLEAIKSLHQKLDDDANGNIDYTESDDFLREELKYDSGYEKRQKVFHRNDDMHISVKELWEIWLRSEVHNWTVEQTTEWLAMQVELPQYVPNFIQHKVTGANLPRLAVNNLNYLNQLGIKDPIHKHKISLKAMDVVLFGPPKDGSQPHWKDLTLILLIILGGVGSWYWYLQNKKFKSNLHRMNEEIDSLQSAEKAFQNLQKQLEDAKIEKESVINEKANLERELKYSASSNSQISDSEISQLRAEVEMLRNELMIAEGELRDKCWAPPAGLQQWLQLTHEIENKAYIKKKLSAEKQLQHAREACEKLKKKRSSLVGAFVSTHGKSIDEVDRSIVEARTALNEVTQELQERVHRWKQIELLCGFNIINNSGLQQLENVLYRNANGRTSGLRGRMNSQDDLDDDTLSIYGSTHQGYLETNPATLQQWKEGDSSGSEASKLEDDISSASAAAAQSTAAQTVHFLIGGETSNFPEESKPPSSLNPRSISNNNISVTAKPSTTMYRSYSQDTNVLTDTATETAPPSSKVSLSESNLNSKAAPAPAPVVDLKGKSLRHKTIKEQPSVSSDDVISSDISLNEDAVSNSSGSIKKKRKLFTFSKKSKKAD